MKTITIANLKGGSGKTTTTAHLAHAYQNMGRSVLVVDADPQSGALKWSEQADWDIPTLGLPAKNLHRQLPGIAGNRYDLCVIDTPPIYDTTHQEPGIARPHGIVLSAMRAADLILVPMAPTFMDLATIPAVLNAIEDAADLVAVPPQVRFLFIRTIWNAGATKTIKKALESLGCQMLSVQIPSREALAQSYGAPITGTLHGYLSVAMEVEDLL